MTYLGDFWGSEVESQVGLYVPQILQVGAVRVRMIDSAAYDQLGSNPKLEALKKPL